MSQHVMLRVRCDHKWWTDIGSLDRCPNEYTVPYPTFEPAQHPAGWVNFDGWGGYDYCPEHAPDTMPPSHTGPRK